MCWSLRATVRHWGSAQPFKTETKVTERWRQENREFKAIFSHMSSLRKPAWATHEALVWFETKNKPGGGGIQL